MTRRVVVTGLGIVSPIGNDLETSWKAALAGVSGIDKVTATQNEERTTTYDLSGRATKDGAARHGVYIVRKNGKSQKLSIK